MHLSRRSVIKQFLVVSVGITFLPACKGENKPSIALKNLDINGDDEKLLAEVSETIIPKNDSPGAKDLSAHLFALKMLDDCYRKEDQQKFVSGLNDFEKLVKQKTSKSFINCSAAEKESVLNDLDKRKADDALSYFYATQKNLTIQAYTTSKFYLTQVHEYKLVPGKYKGCIPVKV